MITLQTSEQKRIKLTPQKEYLDVCKKDYEAMQLSMIFGNSLPFDKLLERMVELEGRFNSILNSATYALSCGIKYQCTDPSSADQAAVSCQAAKS